MSGNSFLEIRKKVANEWQVPMNGNCQWAMASANEDGKTQYILQVQNSGITYSYNWSVRAHKAGQRVGQVLKS